MKKKFWINCFFFNIKQKKIILSIQYQKKLNYLIYNEKGYINSFIPYKSKRQKEYPFIEFNKQIKQIKQININNSNDNNYFVWKKDNDNFSPFSENNYNSDKNSNIKQRIKTTSKKIVTYKNNKNSTKNFTIPNKNDQNNNNMSNMMMKFKDEDINDSQISKLFWRNKFKKERNYNKYIKTNGNESITNIDFNLFDYFCKCKKARNKLGNIKLFKFGVNFYRNQMDIINIFNLIFLNKIMIMHYANEKNNILNQIIEIPIIT